MPTAYITAPSDAAQSLAERLVAERLAACVNRLGCQSTYRWEGDVVAERRQAETSVRPSGPPTKRRQ